MSPGAQSMGPYRFPTCLDVMFPSFSLEKGALTTYVFVGFVLTYCKLELPF